MYILAILSEAWAVFRESAPYIVLGLLFAGLLRAFFSPSFVARHLGAGRILPVIKAAFIGVPIPLCSCGVLPFASGLRRQGANKGAAAAFLIATPESGVDSIAVSYGLLGPLLTIARPLAAFITAIAAGCTINMTAGEEEAEKEPPDLNCPIDGCCDGVDCPPEEHRGHHTVGEKLHAGMKFAAFDLWRDLAPWFAAGVAASGVIGVLVPESILAGYLGGGLTAMLLALAVGMPMYICATASTPIAAALIMKGASPGTALVFLLAGPATNAAAIVTLLKVLGKRAAAIYLTSIALCSVAAGLVVDAAYGVMQLSPRALAGAAHEVLPAGLPEAAAGLLVFLYVFPLLRRRHAGCCPPGGDSSHSCQCRPS